MHLLHPAIVFKADTHLVVSHNEYDGTLSLHMDGILRHIESL